MCQGKFREAEQDLTDALARGSSPFQVRHLRAHARTSLGDRAGAEVDRKAIREERPQRESDYLVRGWTRIETDPKAALADFRAGREGTRGSRAPLEKRAQVRADPLTARVAARGVVSRLVALSPE